MNFSFKKCPSIYPRQRAQTKFYFKIKFIKYEFSFKNALDLPRQRAQTNNKRN